MERSQFEPKISLSCWEFLKAHACVRELAYAERRPASGGDLETWESVHAPLRLPPDVRAFLSISDGLQLRWRVDVAGTSAPLGSMHLNGVAELVPFAEEAYHGKRFVASPQASGAAAGAGAGAGVGAGAADDVAAAFDLDSTCLDGRLALLFRTGVDGAQVWFQNRSGDWYFVATSFTDYYRLMMMHLGVPRWQYAFTEVGLDPLSTQWFRFLCPDRLSIDTRHPAGLAAAPAKSCRPRGRKGKAKAKRRVDLARVDRDVGANGAAAPAAAEIEPEPRRAARRR